MSAKTPRLLALDAAGKDGIIKHVMSASTRRAARAALEREEPEPSRRGQRRTA